MASKTFTTNSALVIVSEEVTRVLVGLVFRGRCEKPRYYKLYADLKGYFFKFKGTKQYLCDFVR